MNRQINSKKIIGLLVALCLSNFAWAEMTPIDTVTFKPGEGPVHTFDTPTRAIFIDTRGCDLSGAAKICAGKVIYNEINKNTGKAIILRGGSSIDKGTGYQFITSSHKRYLMYQVGDKKQARFYVIDSNNKVIEKEELIANDFNRKGTDYFILYSD